MSFSSTIPPSPPYSARKRISSVFPGIFKDKLDDAVIRQHEKDRLHAQLFGDREHGVCKLSGDHLLPRELVDRGLQRGEIGA